jgi:membrane-associated phospholipid phosphatase
MSNVRLQKLPPVVVRKDADLENRTCCQRTGRYLFRHLIDVIFTISLLLIGATATYYPAKPVRFFVERDPTLSYPLTESLLGTIPLSILIVLTIIPTLGIVFGLQIVVWLCQRRRPGAIPHAAVYFWGRPLLMLGQTEGLTLLLTEILKNFQGRMRPHFFAACNYAGYADALRSGDFTAYLAATTTGLPGSLSRCLTPANLYQDAMEANPSGHASIIFAAWTGMALILVYLFRSQAQYWPEHLGKAYVSVFAIAPIIGAALIAATRTRDYVHNYDDVLAGIAIGVGSAVLFFLLNYGTDPHHDGLFRAYKPVTTQVEELQHEGEDDEPASRSARTTTPRDEENGYTGSYSYTATR